MRLRTILMGFVALVFGLSAATGVYLAVSPAKAPDAQTVSIVVVAADVPRGASLTEAMVRLKPWPNSFVPEGAIATIDDAIGRTVWVPLVAGEPVLEAKLAAKGAGRGMAALVPPGMRAVTIQTPNVSTGVAGFILPGNKVDVLLTLSQPGLDDPTGGGGSITLLQNVEILAVDQRIEAPSENVVDPKELRSVTLLVTPEEATKLDLGQNKGTLSLALRNPEDIAIGDVRPATLASLRGITRTQRPQPELAAAPPTVTPPEAPPEPKPEPVEDSYVAAKPAAPQSESETESSLFPTSVLTPTQPAVRVSRIRTLRGVNAGAVFLREGIPQSAESEERVREAVNGEW